VCKRLNPQAEEALWVLDKARMTATLEEAKRLAFSSAEIEKIAELLALPEEDFVKLQLKKAAELEDPVRVINRTIRLRSLFLDKHKAMFEPHLFPKLRSPETFASSKLLASSKKKLAEGMMYFSKTAVPMSLTELEPALNKEATGLFKCLLMYSGERPNPYPPAMALQVLQTGVAQPELRAEIYMQLIKQLRHNPSADSQRRYWELLALALMTFAPGPGCDDFVHVFVKANAEGGGQKFISLLHKVRRRPAPPPPPIAPRRARAHRTARLCRGPVLPTGAVRGGPASPRRCRAADAAHRLFWARGGPPLLLGQGGWTEQADPEPPIRYRRRCARVIRWRTRRSCLAVHAGLTSMAEPQRQRLVACARPGPSRPIEGPARDVLGLVAHPGGGMIAAPMGASDVIGRSGQEGPPPPPAAAGSTKMVACVDCTAEPPSLKFRKGDEIVITQRRDDGWWLGELDGQVGWVFQLVESAICPPGRSEGSGRFYAFQCAAWASWRLAVASAARLSVLPR
jgi:hypothetical protein